jgi:hypothetical protein
MRRFLAAAALAGACIAGLAAPAAMAADPAPTLSTPAQLGRDNAALPRIATPATPATVKINAALAQLDTRWRSFMRQCAAMPGGAGEVGTTRKVTVAMAGPSVLSLAVHEESSCGGAYPNAVDVAFAYDLGAGRPLDWGKLLPAVLVQASTIDTDTEATRIGTITSTRLHALYLAAVKADASLDADLKSQCGDPLSDEGLELQLWPDARQDAVMVQPFGLPHVIAACGFAEPIHTADLRRLGVNPALLDAIDAAHAAAR